MQVLLHLYWFLNAWNSVFPVSAEAVLRSVIFDQWATQSG